MTSTLIEPKFTKLSYTVKEFAAATSYGETTIKEAIAANTLSLSYANSKGVITLEEGLRWLRELPDTPPQAS